MPKSPVQDAIDTIANAEFRVAWPIEVRRTLVKAALTEGELPPYAERFHPNLGLIPVSRALSIAKGVERRMRRQADLGERLKSRKGVQRITVGV